MNKKEELQKIREEVSVCIKCPLHKTRTNIVFGEGDENAEVLFVGEAPGENEDKKGIPFCGAAGKFLDEMLGRIGLNRGDVYITNTLKCRPPGNRDPEDIEKESCKPFLDKQFEIISPLLIVCLGRHSTATFLPGAGGITNLHGKPVKRPNGQVYLPLYHPAAALHNGGLRQTLIDDFTKIPAILTKIKSIREKNDENQEDENKDKRKQLKLI